MLVEDLARKFGTDKNMSAHRYTAMYHYFFNAQRESIKKMLEIGIAGGDSLRMWRDFFPNALITAIDIETAHFPDDPRIKCAKADQGDESQLENAIKDLGGDFDFIVDDGSHSPEHQIESLRVLFKYVVDGGLYIIEDVSNGSQSQVKKEIEKMNLKLYRVFTGDGDDDCLYVIPKI